MDGKVDPPAVDKTDENNRKVNEILEKIADWFLANRRSCIQTRYSRNIPPLGDAIIRQLERLGELEDKIINLWQDNARMTEETLQDALCMTDDEYRLFAVEDIQYRGKHPDVNWGAGKNDDAE